MEDVPKFPYFVTSGGKPKFKRAVPADLTGSVGKKYWIKGAGTLTGSELKAAAHAFAAWTENEIIRHRDAIVSGQPPVVEVRLDLTDHVIDRVLVRYRAERENARIADRSYLDTGELPAHELIAEARDDLTNALLRAEGKLTETDGFVIKMLVRYGLCDPAWTRGDGLLAAMAALQSDGPFQRLCRLIELEDVRLAQSRLDALAEKRLPAMYTVVAPVAAGEQGFVPAEEVASLAHVIEQFWRTKPPSLTGSRRSQINLALRILTEWFGEEVAISSIRRDHCRDLVEFLPRVPAYLAQHFAGAPIKDAVEAYRVKNGAYADRRDEAQKHLAVIRSVFQSATDEGWVEKNPFAGIAVELASRKKHEAAEHTYQPFPVSSLNRLFTHSIFAVGDDGVPKHAGFATHAYWAPIIGLFSGLRMNEILQLEVEDIQTNEAGITVFAVTDEEASAYDDQMFEKRLKNANSLRRVPVHPQLVEFGFLRWLSEKKSGRLFPEATRGQAEKPSDQYSKRFNTVLRSLDIWVPRRQVFHSLRNNFNDALRAAGTPLELREAINGWKQQASMDGRYGRGHTDEVLAQEVAKVDYPGLDLSRLHENAQFVLLYSQ